MKKRAFLLLFVLFAGLPALAVAAPVGAGGSPEALVHEKTEEILHLIERNRSLYSSDRAALYAMVNKRLVPYFDFRRMSRWVLGQYWRKATPAQQDAFTTQFTGLLVRTYATALLSYSGQKIAYSPFRMDPQSDHAVVRTRVIQTNGGPNIPIDYEFVRKADGWKVYDVTIDNVSLVTNYRSVYASKIRRDGLQALIDSMARVNRANP